MTAMSTTKLIFAPVEKVIFAPLEACAYLGLDIGREDDEQAQLEALDRLVDERKTLYPCMYRRGRLYRKAELDRFLESQQKTKA